ncbi:MAG: CDP-diacylglycerol--serine O-phosphatidyltransferase [Deltaproteobacteria bacterium]
MRLRKALFVLPNLFTVSSIFCGFYALAVCAEPGRPGQYYQAAIALLFAMFFDGFDGRVARLTKTQSEFGMQLDSLADAVSFGAAPGLLLYRWALAPLGFAGLFISFAFVACGAMRLARFNVLAGRAHASPNPQAASNHFVGVPIPIAAGAIIALVIAHGVTEAPPPAWPVAAVTLVLSYLMVSNVRYRTFKALRLTRRVVTLLFLGTAAAAIAAIELSPALVLCAAIAGYLAMGLIEQALGFGRARLARRRARLSASGLTAEVDEDDEDDDGDFV